MNDNYDYGMGSRPAGWWGGLPPFFRAALLFAIPFILVDALNYYTAGVSQILSLPVMALLYGGCGALAAKFQADGGMSYSGYGQTGIKAGLCLWGISTVANVVISLVVGAASLGGTLLLGIPYMCLCAPVQLIASALVGALGGWLYGKFSGRRAYDEYQ